MVVLSASSPAAGVEGRRCGCGRRGCRRRGIGGGGRGRNRGGGRRMVTARWRRRCTGRGGACGRVGKLGGCRRGRYRMSDDRFGAWPPGTVVFGIVVRMVTARMGQTRRLVDGRARVFGWWTEFPPGSGVRCSRGRTAPRTSVVDDDGDTPAPPVRSGISGRVAPTKPRGTLATRSKRTTAPVSGASIMSPLPT